MRLGKLGLVVGTFALAICLEPNVGWSTRAFGALVSGEVTAAPLSTEIEIAHHVYHIKANSPAAKAVTTIHVGQTVDAMLDGPASSTASEVITIAPHATS